MAQLDSSVVSFNKHDHNHTHNHNLTYSDLQHPAPLHIRPIRSVQSLQSLVDPSPSPLGLVFPSTEPPAVSANAQPGPAQPRRLSSASTLEHAAARRKLDMVQFNSLGLGMEGVAGVAGAGPSALAEGRGRRASGSASRRHSRTPSAISASLLASLAEPADEHGETPFEDEFDAKSCVPSVRSRTASRAGSVSSSTGATRPKRLSLSITDSPISQPGLSPRLTPLSFDNIPPPMHSTSSSRRSSLRLVSPVALSPDPFYTPSTATSQFSPDDPLPSPVPFPTAPPRTRSEDELKNLSLSHADLNQGDVGRSSDGGDDDVPGRLEAEPLVSFRDFKNKPFELEDRKDGLLRPRHVSIGRINGTSGWSGLAELGGMPTSESSASLLGPTSNRSRTTSHQSGDLIELVANSPNKSTTNSILPTPITGRPPSVHALVTDSVDGPHSPAGPAGPTTPARRLVPRSPGASASAIGSPSSQADQSFASQQTLTDTEESAAESDREEPPDPPLHPLHLFLAGSKLPAIKKIYDAAGLVLVPPVRSMPSLAALQADPNGSPAQQKPNGFEVVAGRKPGRNGPDIPGRNERERVYLEAYLGLHAFRRDGNDWRSIGQTEDGFVRVRLEDRARIEWVPISPTASGPAGGGARHRRTSSSQASARLPLLPEVTALPSLEETFTLAPSDEPPSPVPSKLSPASRPTAAPAARYVQISKKDNAFRTIHLGELSQPAPAPTAKPKPHFMVKWLKRGGTSSAPKSNPASSGSQAGKASRKMEKILVHALDEEVVLNANLPRPESLQRRPRQGRVLGKQLEPSPFRDPFQSDDSPSKSVLAWPSEGSPADQRKYAHHHGRRLRRTSTTSVTSMRTLAPGGGTDGLSAPRIFLADLAFLATPPLGFDSAFRSIFTLTFEMICSLTSEFDPIPARGGEYEGPPAVRVLNNILDPVWDKFAGLLVESEGDDAILREEGANLYALLGNVIIGLLYHKLYSSSILFSFADSNAKLDHILNVYAERDLSPAQLGFGLCDLGVGEPLRPAIPLVASLGPEAIDPESIAPELVAIFMHDVDPDSADGVEKAQLIRQTLAETRTPLGAMSAIFEVMLDITKAINSVQAGLHLAPEDYLYPLEWSIIRSGVHELRSLVHFVETYSLTSTTGPLGWSLTNFNAAVHDLLADPYALLPAQPVPPPQPSPAPRRRTVDLPSLRLGIQYSEPASNAQGEELLASPLSYHDADMVSRPDGVHRERRLSLQDATSPINASSAVRSLKRLSYAGEYGGRSSDEGASLSRTSLEDMLPHAWRPTSSSGRSHRRQSTGFSTSSFTHSLGRLEPTILERRPTHHLTEEQRSRPNSSQSTTGEFGTRPRSTLSTGSSSRAGSFYKGSSRSAASLLGRSGSGGLASPSKAVVSLPGGMVGGIGRTRSRTPSVTGSPSSINSGRFQRTSSEGTAMFSFNAIDMDAHPSATADHLGAPLSAADYLRSAGSGAKAGVTSGEEVPTWWAWGRDKVTSFSGARPLKLSATLASPAVAAVRVQGQGQGVQPKARRNSYSAVEAMGGRPVLVGMAETQSGTSVQGSVDGVPAMSRRSTRSVRSSMTERPAFLASSHSSVALPRVDSASRFLSLK